MKILTQEMRLSPQSNDPASRNDGPRKRAPFVVLLAMVGAILLIDATLPLRALWFHEALLTQLGTWPVLPSEILFPGFAIIPPIPHVHNIGTPDLTLSWLEVSFLLGAFIAVFVVYIVALRRPPGHITRCYLLCSTLLLGFLFCLIPVVTSPDLFSYIAYARMGILYHLNPLTTFPSSISGDPVYGYVAWPDQPSAYGPTWAIITGAMQGFFSLFGLNYILPMLIMLRLFGLLMHMLSTWLIWSICGHLSQKNSFISEKKRMLATLAFAWNPLLLLEACTNAHNDATVLFFVLLAIWFLVRERNTEIDSPSLYAAVFAMVMLALATCLKLYVVLFVPGFLLFLWLQPSRRTIKLPLVSVVSYAGVIGALYAPFWQGGAIFDVLTVNPAASRTINSLPDLLAHLYNASAALLGFPLGDSIGSPAERVLHALSLALFALVYCIVCWRAIRGTKLGGRIQEEILRGRPLRAPLQGIATVPGLVRWMALVWLLFCVIGSPWYWPWYAVTFFGLYAVVEAVSDEQNWTYYVRLLAFSTLSIYCFIAWGPRYTLVPGLPGFAWTYFGALWVWGLPLLGLALIDKLRHGRLRIQDVSLSEVTGGKTP